LLWVAADDGGFAASLQMVSPRTNSVQLCKQRALVLIQEGKYQQLLQVFLATCNMLMTTLGREECAEIVACRILKMRR
jgi:hypothetical protein